MFFNQPLAARSANGSLWCGEIREESASVSVSNQRIVRRSLACLPSLSLSLSVSPPPLLSLPLSSLHLLTLICSTDYCCILLSPPPLLPPFILSSQRLVLICCMHRLRRRTAKCDSARPWRRTGDALQKRRIRLKDVAVGGGEYRLMKKIKKIKNKGRKKVQKSP